MALNRITNETLKVNRDTRKIALEEAVGVPFFDALDTYPPIPVMHGLDVLPFDKEFVQDIQRRLQDVDARIKSMDQSGISFCSRIPDDARN